MALPGSASAARRVKKRGFANSPCSMWGLFPYRMNEGFGVVAILSGIHCRKKSFGQFFQTLPVQRFQHGSANLPAASHLGGGVGSAAYDHA